MLYSAPIMKRARDNGMMGFLNVDILIIDCNMYTIYDLTKLPSELDPAKIATKEVGDNTLFFGGCQSPLSNFHI